VQIFFVLQHSVPGVRFEKQSLSTPGILKKTFQSEQPPGKKVLRIVPSTPIAPRIIPLHQKTSEHFGLATTGDYYIALANKLLHRDRIRRK
jgi:hypothetical protein